MTDESGQEQARLSPGRTHVAVDVPGADSRDAFFRVFPGVMMAMFLAAADQTILASALPTIATSLHGLADLSWVVVAYLLAATIAAPLYGHLGDHFGRRNMLLGALAIFTLASLGCALAPTLLLLIIARAAQGLGGGGLMTLSQALIGEHVAPRERGRYAGYFATIFALASTSGPVAGAYLTEHLSWRAIFIVNLPLGLLAALLALRVPQTPLAPRGRFRPDVVGAVLFALSTFTLLYALSSGGHRYAWMSWRLLSMLGCAVVGYLLLFFWERRAADPVIPIALLRIPAILRSDLVVICFASILFSTILYLPLYLQLARGVGIGQSGLLLLPITLSMVVTSTVTGRLVTKTGDVTLFPQLGLSVASVTFLTLAFGLDHLSTAAVMVLTGFIGVGIGMVMPPTQVNVQFAAGRAALGSAIGSIAFSRAIGGAVGVAIVGALLFAMVGSSMESLPAMIGESAVSASTALEPAHAIFIGQFDHAYRVIFGLLAAIAALGVVVARTIPRPDWSKNRAP